MPKLLKILLTCSVLFSCEKQENSLEIPFGSNDEPSEEQYGSIGVRIIMDPGTETNWCILPSGYYTDLDYRVTGTTSITGGKYVKWTKDDVEYHLTVRKLKAGSNYVISIQGHGGRVCSASSTCGGRIGSWDIDEIVITTMPGGGAIEVKAGLVTELAPVTRVVIPGPTCN